MLCTMLRAQRTSDNATSVPIGHKKGQAIVGQVRIDAVAIPIGCGAVRRSLNHTNLSYWYDESIMTIGY